MNYTYIKITICISLVGITLQLLAQPLSYIATDRYHYTSGDAVFFSAFQFFETDSNSSEACLYLYLTNSKKQWIKKEIIPLKKGLGNGYFILPDSLSTGIHQLHAHTYSEGRNASYKKCSKAIFITNRFGAREPIYTSDSINNEVIAITKDTIKDESDNWKINARKSTFKPREEVIIDISTLTDDTAYYSVTVIPKYTIPQNTKGIVDIYKNNSKQTNTTKKGYTEQKGLVLTGKITNKITNNAIANAIILLSTQDSTLRLRHAVSNAEGEFTILLNNYYGTMNFYLSAYELSSMRFIKNTAFHINSKFTESTPFQQTKLQGYKPNKDTIGLKKSVIAKAYNLNYLRINEDKAPRPTTYESKFVMSNSHLNINLDDYIYFRSFNEIITEVMPGINLKTKDKGKHYLTIMAPTGRVMQNPILFVDGIPLPNIEKLLPWGSSKIKNIQIEFTPRYYGNVYFQNGIILVWTKKQDFWDNAEIPEVNKVKYQVFQIPGDYSFPNYKLVNNKRTPDYRPTLYWNPLLKSVKGVCNEITFFTSDELGEFSIILEGKTSNNTPIQKTFSFTVE